MRPSIALRNKRGEVLDIIGLYAVKNPRVFGSVLHGTDSEGSDLDILVDILPGSGFAFFELEDRLEKMLGVHVDLVTPGFLHEMIRDAVIAEARPL